MMRLAENTRSLFTELQSQEKVYRGSAKRRDDGIGGGVIKGEKGALIGHRPWPSAWLASSRAALA